MAKRFKNFILVFFAIVILVSCGEQTTPTPLTASDYPENGSEHFQLYLTKCGECHAAPLPKIHTARQWLSVVQRMQFRMTSKAIPALNENEMGAIVNYLQKHASDSISQNNTQNN